LERRLFSFDHLSAGRWDAIATQIIIQENLSLAEAATLYAKVSLALSDAAVGCWNNKFKYNVERPVDYIRANIESDWNTMMKPGTGEIHITLRQLLPTPQNMRLMERQRLLY
jgi:hypothetical protein